MEPKIIIVNNHFPLNLLFRPDKLYGKIQVSDDLDLNDPTIKVVFTHNPENIRKIRKDIFLIGLIQLPELSEYSQYILALDLLKKQSCNLVFAYSSIRNMVVVPEEARYHVSDNIDETINGLLEIVSLRRNLTFTRSTVLPGDPIPWKSELIPFSLRMVVDHCIANKAYKPFNDATAGHFATKIDDNTFLTSIRKSNFNRLNDIGLVKVVAKEQDVVAYGAKPSVGGQSQRIVFKDHPDTDCIVHFHCPRKTNLVPSVSQRGIECGSHQCGINTSNGLKKFDDGIYAVYLDNHGPNIVFNQNVKFEKVISFIDNNFKLDRKTDE